MLMSYNFILFADIPNNEWVNSISYKLFMVHTLIPNEALSVVGPWWFYGLIVQLYLLFIPMFYLIKKWKLKGFLLLITLSYIIVFLLYDPLEKNGIFIMANAPAHIPEFTLGILLALYPKFNLKPIYLPLLLLIFILGNFYFYFFPYTFIIVTYLMLVVILFVFKKKRFFSSVIAFYGKLSMFLFAIHGFIRNPFFVNTANSSNNPFINFALSLLYLLTATILAYLTRAIYLAMKKKVSLTLLKVNELLNTLQYQNTDEIQ